MARVRADIARAASDLELLLGRLRRRVRSEAPAEGIPLSQMSVLMRVVREGPETASGLAAAEHVRAQSMALTVGNLESQRLVEKAGDRDDRRRILVIPTEEGRRLVATVQRSREAWLARAIAACLSHEEQDLLVQALALLERLAVCDPNASSQTSLPPVVETARDVSEPAAAGRK